MQLGGGKAKGAGWERELCKALSLWVTGGTRDDIFWRSAMSGGRASVKFKHGGKNLTQVGDISAIDPLGEPLIKTFVIEAKFYREIGIERAITRTDTKLHRFWHELVEKAEQVQRRPMLIARQNRVPAFVCLDPAGVEQLKLTGHIICYLPAYGIRIVWLDKLLHFAVPPK